MVNPAIIKLIISIRTQIIEVIQFIEFIGRSYKDYNKEDFQDQLRGYSWIDFFGIDNPNKCWENVHLAMWTLRVESPDIGPFCDSPDPLKAIHQICLISGLVLFLMGC